MASAGIVFIVRIGSFFLQPHLITQGAIIIILILLLCVLYFKNPDWAWYIVLVKYYWRGWTLFGTWRTVFTHSFNRLILILVVKPPTQSANLGQAIKYQSDG